MIIAKYDPGHALFYELNTPMVESGNGFGINPQNEEFMAMQPMDNPYPMESDMVTAVLPVEEKQPFSSAFHGNEHPTVGFNTSLKLKNIFKSPEAIFGASRFQTEYHSVDEIPQGEIEKNLKHTGYDFQLNGTIHRLHEVRPSEERVRQTMKELENQGRHVTIIIPTLNEAENIEETLKAVEPAVKFGFANVVMYDSGSKDSTPEMARKMGVNVRDSGEQLAKYGIPDIKGKGTNLYLAVLDRLMEVPQDEWKNEILIFLDAGNGLGITEATQLLAPFADDPKINLVLPFVKRLTQRGLEGGKVQGGGRVTNFNFAPNTAEGVGGATRKLQHQLAGAYAVTLDSVADLNEFPNAWGVETAIQYNAFYKYGPKKEQVNQAVEEVAYAACGEFKQKGQKDKAIRAMAHIVTYEEHRRMFQQLGVETEEMKLEQCEDGLYRHVLEFEDTDWYQDENGIEYCDANYNRRELVFFPAASEVYNRMKVAQLHFS